MQTMRESWTDERLDDLKENVSERFDQMDKRFEQVDKRFEQVDRRFEQVDQRFDRLERRFEGEIGELRRLTLYGFIGLATMMVTGFTGLAFS